MDNRGVIVLLAVAGIVFGGYKAVAFASEHAMLTTARQAV
jgi:hypothetical protein